MTRIKFEAVLGRSSCVASTISYNTEPFLRDTLHSLVKAGKIAFAAWAFHKFEGDEASKDHFHVYVEPITTLDYRKVKDDFQEMDLLHPSQKPLGVQFFRYSVWDHWYFYAYHDEEYIRYLVDRGKTKPKKYFYDPGIIQATDEDELRSRVYSARRPIDDSKQTIGILRQAVNSGRPFDELVDSGLVPLSQMFAVKEAYGLIMRARSRQASKEGGSASAIEDASATASLGASAEPPAQTEPILPFKGELPTYPKFPLGANSVLDSDEGEDDSL